MHENQQNDPRRSQLSRLIQQRLGAVDQGPGIGGTAAGAGAWQRLNLDRVARRLIASARVATAEHLMSRVAEAARRRDQRLEALLGGSGAEGGRAGGPAGSLRSPRPQGSSESKGSTGQAGQAPPDRAA